MELELTVVAGPGLDAFSPTEFTVVWPASDTGSSCSGVSLRKALEARWPGCSFSIGGQALDALRCGTAPLIDGAVVVVQPSATLIPGGTSSAGSSEGIAAFLCVCSGPEAGKVFALQRGRYTLGRGHCRLTIADPALSRHHGTLCVTAREITLSSVAGSSGFLLRRGGHSPTASAEPLKGTQLLTVGQQVQCGSSIFELRLPVSAQLSEAVEFGDTRLLNAAMLEPLVVHQETNPVRNRVAMILSGTLPLLLGVGLALLMGSWMFLAFSAMGAIAVLIPLLGGSQRRKAFRAAVSLAASTDAERRAVAFPDAASLMLGAHSPEQEQPRGQPRAGPLTELAVRLGIADQRAAVAVSPADTAFTPPIMAGLPLTVTLGSAPVTIGGPSGPVGRLLNFVLMQLDAAHVPVVLCGHAADVPMAARFLPRTTLVGSPTAAARAVTAHRTDTQGIPGPVLVSLNGLASDLLAALPDLPALCFTILSGSSPLVELQAVGDRLRGTFGGQGFVPDGVPAAALDAYARSRALQCAAPKALDAAGLRPNTLPQPELCSISAILQEWERTAGGSLAPVRVGLSAAGPAFFDFVRDGPHLLLGGTTGSGKSELLRTIVGSLATTHSPADLQFVFIDFKGGAGLGALTKLPHTCSLITDLSGHGMNRMLASLRAELRHREEALASIEATDSQGYRTRRREASMPPGATAMTHLLIVVDEFRMLVDQFPDAMNELMRIAAVGRSLGIHLLLATQRPQGAVSADIRANVTSSICLRVQSPFDSTDVVGTPIAATIAVDTPGRAFISRAGSTPEEFQSATLRLPSTGSDTTPSLELVTERLSRMPHQDAQPGVHDSDIATVAALLSAAWGPYAIRTQHHCAPIVVADELPTGEELAAGFQSRTMDSPQERTASVAGVLLGIVDVPQQQSLEELRWDPERHSHLAFFGTPTESSNAIAMLVQQLVSANAEPGDREPFLLYLLDGDGSLKSRSHNDCVGAYLTPADLRAASRLLQRLVEAAQQHPERSLIVCCSEWGRWLTAFRSSPWHEAEDAMSELIRFGQSNLVVVIGGARELVSAPFLAAIPNRMYLTQGSSAESTVLWPRLPDFDTATGRAAISGPIARSATLGATNTDDLLIAQLGTPSQRGVTTESSYTTPAGGRAQGILRLTPLPCTLTLSQMQQALTQTPWPGSSPTTEHLRAARRSLVLGLGGDGHQIVQIAVEPGTVLPVVGSPGCGKSSLLRLLALLNNPEEPAHISYLDDASALPLDRLRETNERLAQGQILVAAFSYPGPGLAALPLEWGLRAPQQGIVVSPQRPGDAELFGVRLDTMGSEPAGRAVLLDRGRRSWFQFPYVEVFG
ncbi:FtsK/SpoIIIE domain-containing protein [Arthrobacter psychrolactophilus]